jgi:hypothetical protein
VATISELENSIKSINTGKSADIYNITIEHIINAGEQMITSTVHWILDCQYIMVYPVFYYGFNYFIDDW